MRLVYNYTHIWLFFITLLLFTTSKFNKLFLEVMNNFYFFANGIFPKTLFIHKPKIFIAYREIVTPNK